MDKRMELQLAVQHKRWPEVEAIAAELVQHGDHGDPPGSVEYYLGLARHAQGKCVGATHAFAEARKLLPTGNRLLADTLIAAAFNFWSYGGDRTATSTLEEFQRRRAEFGDLDYHDGMAEQIMGNIAMRDERIEQAIRHYSTAVSKFTDFQRRVAAQLDLGLSYLDAGQKDKAEETWKAASTELLASNLKSGDLRPQLQAGMALLRAKLDIAQGMATPALVAATEGLRIAILAGDVSVETQVRLQLIQARALVALQQPFLAHEKAQAAAMQAAMQCLSRLQREAQELVSTLPSLGGISHA